MSFHNWALRPEVGISIPYDCCKLLVPPSTDTQGPLHHKCKPPGKRNSSFTPEKHKPEILIQNAYAGLEVLTWSEAIKYIQ